MKAFRTFQQLGCDFLEECYRVDDEMTHSLLTYDLAVPLTEILFEWGNAYYLFLGTN